MHTQHKFEGPLLWFQNIFCVNYWTLYRLVQYIIGAFKSALEFGTGPNFIGTAWNLGFVFSRVETCKQQANNIFFVSLSLLNWRHNIWDGNIS